MLDLEHDWDGVPLDGVRLTQTRELWTDPTSIQMVEYRPGRSRFVIEGNADLVRRISDPALIEAAHIDKERTQ